MASRKKMFKSSSTIEQMNKYPNQCFHFHGTSFSNPHLKSLQTFMFFLGEFNIVWDTHLQNESIVGTRMILG